MPEPQTLLEAVRHFGDLSRCEELMLALKWPDGKIACPKCGGESVGRVASRRLLQCKAAGCRKQFSAKVGTIFEDSPLGLDKWFVAVWSVANGDTTSSVALANALGIRQGTAWSMLDRIREATLTEEFRLADPDVEYRPVPGYPGYRVGSNGSVWSRWRGNANLGRTWTILHPSVNGHGYRCVDLRNGTGRRVMQTVASVVLEAFVGPRPGGLEVRHLDGRQTNDRRDNLAWGTSLENAADKRRHGTTARGERQGHAVLTDAQVAETRRLDGKVSRAERFCVPLPYMHKICRGDNRPPVEAVV